MKKSILIVIVLLLLAIGSFAFFKSNNIKEVQGKILDQVGQGSLFNNLFKKAGSFIEEGIEEKKPEVKEEFKKEKEELKTGLKSTSEWILDKLGSLNPIDYVKDKIINNDSSALDSSDSSNCCECPD